MAMPRRPRGSRSPESPPRQRRRIGSDDEGGHGRCAHAYGQQHGSGAAAPAAAQRRMDALQGSEVHPCKAGSCAGPACLITSHACTRVYIDPSAQLIVDCHHSPRSHNVAPSTLRAAVTAGATAQAHPAAAAAAIAGTAAAVVAVAAVALAAAPPVATAPAESTPAPTLAPHHPTMRVP